MATTIDRFETAPRDNGGRVKKGWRITRYSFGACTVQHLRTGRSCSGVVDDHGNVIWPANNVTRWQLESEELVPFYREGCLPPHWKPGNDPTGRYMEGAQA